MIDFLKFCLKNPKRLKHLRLCEMLLLKNIKVPFGKVQIYKPAKVKFEKSSRIFSENGILTINKKHTSKDPFPSLLLLRENSKIIVNGSFSIYSGSRIHINRGATLILGSGYINNNLNLSCFDRIEIGNNVAIAENLCIRDSDNHHILDSAHIKTKPIAIGNHVWIGMNVTILKGVTIGDGAIIAAGSLVNKDIPPMCLAGGVPARVIKHDVSWQ